MSRDDTTLTVAMIHEVFCGSDGAERLHDRLREARTRGAQLALLPELPMDPWVPATRRREDSDAEEPGGPRHRTQASAARDVGIGLMGGAITVDAVTGERRNRALLFDARGRLVSHYDKLHVPHEEGFWEADHYAGGDEPPRPLTAFGMTVGLQVCSDLFRPEICHVLGAMGCEMIAAPRCTPVTSLARWRARIVANAVSSGAYVISANRTGPEHGVPIGGGGIAAAPDGSVLVESTDPVCLVELARAVVNATRREYPGYLPVRAELYARAWNDVGSMTVHPPGNE